MPDMIKNIIINRDLPVDGPQGPSHLHAKTRFTPGAKERK
ncbi:hypothetical protein BN1221_03404 [Brenneria goodwinii]|uniref:Uncharacterized protein n=1 Tax=Brenneria goodwinii TaxID=1109412 RepID=A0A0G4JYW6_9GAMM|nr:hypothetical protein BN1221_03404 [Brenneria goodwinii]